jgi:hypothetical protein
VDSVTVFTIGGVAIALLSAVAGVWSWRRRRRRAAADCGRIRDLLVQLRESLGEGNGLMFKDHGIFIGREREVIRRLGNNTPFVVDRRLRKALLELIKVYDDAEASAIVWEPAIGDRMALVAAASLIGQEDHPKKRAPLVLIGLSTASPNWSVGPQACNVRRSLLRGRPSTWL